MFPAVVNIKANTKMHSRQDTDEYEVIDNGDSRIVNINSSAENSQFQHYPSSHRLMLSSKNEP